MNLPSKPRAYVPGQHCRRGRHEWTEDHGTWARCGKCGSTRQKPRELSIKDWLLLGKVHCPDCEGEPGQGRTDTGTVCSTCGGDAYLTRNEYNYLWRLRKDSSPSEVLEGPI